MRANFGAAPRALEHAVRQAVLQGAKARYSAGGGQIRSVPMRQLCARGRPAIGVAASAVNPATSRQ